MHDAFLSAFLAWDEITVSKAAWLKRAVHTKIIDRIRECERPADVSVEFAGLRKNTQRVQLQRSRDAEEWCEVRETFEAVQALPHHLRCAVILRFQGSDDDEIAHVLDVQRPTVRRYVSEALQLVTEAVGNPDRRLSARRAQRPRRTYDRIVAHRTEGS